MRNIAFHNQANVTTNQVLRDIRNYHVEVLSEVNTLEAIFCKLFSFLKRPTKLKKKICYCNNSTQTHFLVTHFKLK